MTKSWSEGEGLCVRRTSTLLYLPGGVGVRGDSVIYTQEDLLNRGGHVDALALVPHLRL